MRPPAALERAWGSGAPGRDRGASRPSGALTRVHLTAPSPHIPPRAPRYARDPLTLRPTLASALLQPGPAGCRRGRGARWARRGVSAHAARDRVGRVGRAERSARRLASAGCPCRRRRCAEHADRAVLARAWPVQARPVQARAGTGAQGAAATFLVGISSSRRARSVGAPAPLPRPAQPYPRPYPRPPLDALRPLRACRLLRVLPRPRRLGRHAQAHAARLALRPAPARP